MAAKKKAAATDDPTTRTISLLPYQWEFLSAPEKYVFFKAGIGTGKTHAASAFVVQMIIEQPPETVGFIGAESHRQLLNAVFPALKKAFEAAGIKYEWNEGKNSIIANGRKIIYNSMDEGSINAILGSEIGWFWIDEADYAPLYSLELVNSRLRCPRATRLLGRYTSSPNGYKNMYDMFVASEQDGTRRMVSATTYDNPHLPPSYIDDLKKQYTPLQFRQQVMAEFVNLQGGQVYDCFSEDKHKIEFDHKQVFSKTYLGLDFNVAQMCAVAVKFENNTFYVYDEYYLLNSNTIKMTQEVARREPNYRKDLLVVPDSTFEARSVTSATTSKEILRRAGFQVMSTRNPYHGERQQAINNLFWNEGKDVPRILIHPRCSNLIKELNTLTPDDKEGEVSHLAVALGYVVWKLDPLRRSKRQSRIIQ